MEREAAICAERQKLGVLDAKALRGDEDYLPPGLHVEVSLLHEMTRVPREMTRVPREMARVPREMTRVPRE